MATQSVVCSPNILRTLGLTPVPHKLDAVVHACDFSTWKTEAGGP